MSKRVDEVINKAIENNKIIGTVTLICKDGNLIYKNVAGYAGEEKTKMELDSIFRLASVTKPIVSAAALVLVSKKIIGLDDPITKWLPDFQPRLMNGDKPSIDVIDKQKIVTQYLSCSPIPKRMGDFPLKKSGFEKYKL